MLSVRTRNISKTSRNIVNTLSYVAMYYVQEAQLRDQEREVMMKEQEEEQRLQEQIAEAKRRSELEAK